MTFIYVCCTMSANRKSTLNMCRDSSSVILWQSISLSSSSFRLSGAKTSCYGYKTWAFQMGLFKKPWALAPFPSFPLTPKNHRIIFTPEKCHFTRCWPHFHHVYRASRQRLDQQSFLYHLDFTIFHVGNILQQRLHLMIQRYFIPKTWKNWKTNKPLT